ncbi:OmpA family protein [Lacinutrix sp. Bg11-31]|uniref:OmpA family protein n=1 Tax=Lacinutrix sp. Bg11-31 TaxID=2057808 RepID=UPI000C3143C1|nr:OmpA family protein [Lacinutrix sp. Bg11-31]AUC82860.1 flagellar motor protein MotB [Lacinutrix sp. Bg11-31]
MSKKTSYLLGILLTIILGTILYYFFCCKPCLEASNKEAEIENSVAEPEVKAATKNAFSIIDSKSSLKFDAKENFNFKGSAFSILEPVSEGLKGQLERLSKYIKDNPGKNIDITGHYTSEENNNSAFPNLGLARANAVKNYFVSHGISSKVINTFGKLDDDLVPDTSNIHFGPLSYTIKTRNANDTSEADELKELHDAMIANPLVLYFDTASASINLNAEQRDKVAKMVRYVDKTDNASIKTIGHTDNTGNRENNVRLGLDRAEFAKSYLVRNGISSSNINSSSKGPDEPIADNNTDEGKAKNRRVVVTLN